MASSIHYNNDKKNIMDGLQYFSDFISETQTDMKKNPAHEIVDLFMKRWKWQIL